MKAAIAAVFNPLIFQPLYNALIALTLVVPSGDLGIAIIALTALVKIALMPLAHRSLVTQRRVRDLNPHIEEIRKKHTDREVQARKIMEVYRTHGVNPFSGFLLILVQIPIFIGLYLVFRQGVELHADLLYSFLPAPERINTLFLGLVNLEERNYLFAALVAITQFLQARLSLPPVPAQTDTGESFANEFARGMQLQMKYVLPIMIGVISIGFPAALVLYWITNNVFTIIHELMVRRKALEAAAVVAPTPAEK